MKILTTLILCLGISFSESIAQQSRDIRKLSELVKKGNLLYLQNTPYTGQAIDFDGPKPNPKNFRFDGFFINGLPNGRIKKWYSNFQLEYEENYVMGIREGQQISYYENGQKKEESNFSNGKLSGNYEFYFPNGRIKRATNYSNDVPTDTLIKEFNDSGQLVLVEITRDNGQTKIFRTYLSDKISEISYFNKYKISEGEYDLDLNKSGLWKNYKAGSNLSSWLYKSENYIKNKYHGSIEEYSEDGTILSRSFYKDGMIDKYASGLVRYHTPNYDQILVACPNLINHDFAIIRITKPTSLSNSHFKKTNSTKRKNSLETNKEKVLLEFLYNIIGERGIFVINESELKKYENDTIFYELIISEPTINFATSPVTYKDGRTGTGYCCTIGLYAKLSYIVTNEVENFTYYSSTCPQGATTFGASSQFYASEDNAYTASITGAGTFTKAILFSGQVLKFVYNTFPVCNIITAVDERDGKNLIKRIFCKTSSYSSLPTNLKFNAYTESDLRTRQNIIATLKIKEANFDGFKLKVDEGEEKITSSFDSNQKIYVVSDLFK